MCARHTPVFPPPRFPSAREGRQTRARNKTHREMYPVWPRHSGVAAPGVEPIRRTRRHKSKPQKQMPISSTSHPGPNPGKPQSHPRRSPTPQSRIEIRSSESLHRAACARAGRDRAEAHMKGREPLGVEVYAGVRSWRHRALQGVFRLKFTFLRPPAHPLPAPGFSFPSSLCR